MGHWAEMTDIIGTLVFLRGFSAELKARKEGGTGPVCTDTVNCSCRVSARSGVSGAIYPRGRGADDVCTCS